MLNLVFGFTTVRNEKLQGLQILQFLSLLYKVAFQVSASCSRKNERLQMQLPEWQVLDQSL